jgi:HlyD family secretion protein
MKRFHGLVLLSVLFISCSGGRERTKPVLKAITESVYASAKVKSADQYEVYSTVSGILEQALVEAGDEVKAGDPLFVLDNRNAALSAESARLAYAKLREENSIRSNKIEEMELNVKLARDKYQLDSSLYARQSNLWKNEVGTQLDLEQRRLNFLNSRNTYLAARNKLQQLKEDLRIELNQANIQYRINVNQQADFVIRSAFKGKVFNVLKEKGELITPQVPLAIIGNANSFILEMAVDEYDIARVKPGQPVEIAMDSYKGQVFQGRVDKIHPIIDERQRTFRVDAHFLNPPPVLYPNLTAEASIIIQSKNKAVLIPSGYLIDNKYVLISKDERKAVEVGLSDYRMVEITKGLDTTQFIYKPQ